MKSCGTSPRKPVPAWGSAGLGCVCAAAEITVLGMPTLFVLVDLLKQFSASNSTPEWSWEPSATMWHLDQEATLVTSPDTWWTDGDTHSSVIVFGRGREGLPGVPPPASPFYPSKSEFPVAAGSPPSVCWVLLRCTSILTRPYRS